MHTVKNTSQILVAASDGIIRIFPNDNLKCTPKPLIFCTDRFLRSEAAAAQKHGLPLSIDPKTNVSLASEFICTEDGVHYIVAITSTSILD